MKITIIIFLMIFYLIINTHAQTSQSLYLNRVGFCEIEVGYDVHVVGDLAYVTNNDGLIIIDVQNPRNPQVVGESLIGGSIGFIIEDNIAYIASVTSGFKLVNVSNPSNPILLGSESTLGAYKIALADIYAYVSYMNGGFKIFNVSNPATPIFKGEYIDSRTDDIQFKDDEGETTGKVLLSRMKRYAEAVKDMTADSDKIDFGKIEEAIGFVTKLGVTEVDESK